MAGQAICHRLPELTIDPREAGRSGEHRARDLPARIEDRGGHVVIEWEPLARFLIQVDQVASQRDARGPALGEFHHGLQAIAAWLRYPAKAQDFGRFIRGEGQVSGKHLADLTGGRELAEELACRHPSSGNDMERGGRIRVGEEAIDEKAAGGGGQNIEIVDQEDARFASAHHGIEERSSVPRVTVPDRAAVI
ncbi:MAG TPA: hypothetical protein VNP95_04375, partial [Thermomicrobiales bacterium]|nr:hypothetical protein [Thermomicrobiales bacterium]